jgi:hypothetical protein
VVGALAKPVTLVVEPVDEVLGDESAEALDDKGALVAAPFFPRFFSASLSALDVFPLALERAAFNAD